MSEINRRRVEVFKKNKRGYYSLIIFTTLFILSLFAKFIANDKPLLLSYEGKAYFPVFVSYPESEFGGFFESEANYQDQFVQDLIEESGFIVWAPIRYSYDSINYNTKTPPPTPPNAHNLLGTDDQGRDILARLIYGFQISVIFGLALTIISSIIGVAAGAFQGYYGGSVDLFGQRFIEIWSGLPVLFLLIILSSFVEPNFWWLLGIMLLFSWMSLTGVVRAEFLKGRNLEYVKAAKALGVSDFKIMFVHILPNAMVATLTFMPFILSGSITTLTGLDFLGFGMPPGSPSLGELLAQGKNNINAPWIGISAFLTLSIMLTMLVFIGEALRDAFDPRIIKSL